MRYYSYWGYFSPENYRVMKSFKYSGQKKKEHSSKQEWREYKGINKDKARSGRWQKSWKKHLKHYAARKHRTLERQAITELKLDRLHRTSYKYAENPWSWD